MVSTERMQSQNLEKNKAEAEGERKERKDENEPQEDIDLLIDYVDGEDALDVVPERNDIRNRQSMTRRAIGDVWYKRTQSQEKTDSICQFLQCF